MFEIKVFDNKVTNRHDYAVRANFKVPTKDTSALLWQDVPSYQIAFTTDTYEFNCKFSVAFEVGFNYNLPSFVGRTLRGYFVDAFQQNSLDSINRAMRVIASEMNDPGFEIGFLHGITVSAGMAEAEINNMLKWKPDQDYGYKWKTGGYVKSDHNPFTSAYQTGGKVSYAHKTAFSEAASRFSTKEIFLQRVVHPVNGNDSPLRSVIMDLNDNHKWTREQIADWIETLDININMTPKEKEDVGII